MNLNLERLIENTISIQKIPAPTFHEDQRAEYLYNAFVAAGSSSVEMDAAGNVYAKAGSGEGIPLVISAHLDTVFPDDAITAAERRNNRLYGPGVGDNAVALAALLELAAEYGAAEDPHPIWLVANVGEEGLGNLLGMQHLVERFGDQVLAYLVIEGMALGHIYHQGLPVRRFRLHAQTEGGHAWIHAGRPSAIHILVELGRDLLRIRRPRNQPFSVNLGRFVGGTTVNSIASEASMELDLRSNEVAALDRWIASLESLIRQSQTENVTIRLEAIGHRPAGQIPEDHSLVQHARTALERAGVELTKLGSGSTDANLPLSFGLPSICIGLTRGGGAHSMQEFIELEPIASGYQALTNLIDLVLADGPPAH